MPEHVTGWIEREVSQEDDPKPIWNMPQLEPLDGGQSCSPNISYEDTMGRERKTHGWLEKG